MAKLNVALPRTSAMSMLVLTISCLAMYASVYLSIVGRMHVIDVSTAASVGSGRCVPSFAGTEVESSAHQLCWTFFYPINWLDTKVRPDFWAPPKPNPVPMKWKDLTRAKRAVQSDGFEPLGASSDSN